MNTERLRDLLRAVEAAEPETFDMGSWDCGTKACAVGHYCKAYPGRDLILYRHPGHSPQPVHLPTKHVGFWAVAEHFDISYGEAVCLFDKAGYLDTSCLPDIRHVADKAAVVGRIRKFILEHEVLTHGGRDVGFVQTER